VLGLTPLGTGSFFSGSPNLAARFARTSTLIPRGAGSKAAALVFCCVLGSVRVAAAFVGVGAVRFDGALGSKGIPKCSARAFRDF